MKHFKTVHNKKALNCAQCNRSFTDKFSLKKYLGTHKVMNKESQYDMYSFTWGMTIVCSNKSKDIVSTIITNLIHSIEEKNKIKGLVSNIITDIIDSIQFIETKSRFTEDFLNRRVLNTKNILLTAKVNSLTPQKIITPPSTPPLTPKSNIQTTPKTQIQTPNSTLHTPIDNL